MHRIFLPIYHFFQKHKGLMYLTMVASAAVFVYFALQLRYEEEVLKLLPRSSMDSELAFSEIGLKDKIFIQVTSADSLQTVSTDRLGEGIDQFCEQLLEQDSTSQHIAGLLYRLDAGLALSAMDFALEHLPTFVDTAWYRNIEAALAPEAISAQMQRNYDLIMEDETGTDTQLVSMDPLALRNYLTEILMPGNGESVGGFTLDGGHLFCPDKTVALAFLSPNFDGMDSGVATQFNRRMEKVLKRFEAENPDLRVLVHGNPPGSVSNASTIKTDLVFTVGLSLLLILLIILLSFHHFGFVWQQILPIGYGATFGLACMYWIKGFMSLLALGIGAIVLGVAISYCLHVLIHYYYVGDAEKMLRDESTPVFLGCLTTIGAFMGLIFTDSDLLRDFGLFATFSLAGNTIFALVFLPHMLHPGQIRYKRTHGFPLVEKINNLPWDRNKWIIGSLVALIAVGVVFSPKVKFDSDLRNLDFKNPALRESENLYNSKVADGYTHLYFAAYSEGDLNEALEYNEGLFHCLDSMKAAGPVKGYSDMTRLLLIPEKQQQERIEAWKQFWSPRKIAALKQNIRSAAREYGLNPATFDPFFALLQTDYTTGDLVNSGIIPPGLLANYVEQQKEGRIMVFTDVSFAKEDTDVVTDALVACPNVFVIEPFYYCRDMVEIIHEDFSRTLWISSLFVLIVLLISFRNVWTALIAFLPMFVSWYVLQGYMALLGLEFNLINIVISTFIYGIGVDYSIFVMEGLLREARTGEKDMLTYHKVAIFYSALVLAIVTFSLVFARHPAIHSIGIITLIGMASTILITYSLQPFAFRQLLKIPYLRRKFGVTD